MLPAQLEQKQKSVLEQIWCCGALPRDCIRLRRCCRCGVCPPPPPTSLPKQVNSVKLHWWNGSWQICVAKGWMATMIKAWENRHRSYSRHGHGEHRVTKPMRDSGVRWMALDWAAPLQDTSKKKKKKLIRDFMFMFFRFIQAFGQWSTQAQSLIRPNASLPLACCSGVPARPLKRSLTWPAETVSSTADVTAVCRLKRRG